MLSEWLRVVNARGALLARVSLIAPWGVSVPASRDCMFHLIREGSCWLRHGQNAALEIRPGDLVLLPKGDAHDLVHEPDAVAEPMELVVARPEQRGSGPRTTLICGSYQSERGQPLPWKCSLPQVIHLRAAEVARDEALSSLFELIFKEVEHSGPGVETLLPALFDALLLYTLRWWGRKSCGQNGWMAGLEDPILSVSLQRMHAEPGAAWTVEGLAREAGLSRAAFAKRFAEVFGQAPLAYLTYWRMHLAAKRFATSEDSLVEVAAQLGYQSEFSFSRAFKRRWGVAPSVYRKQTRAAQGVG